MQNNTSKRVAKKEILFILGEGLTEEIFINYLKKLYHERGNNFSLIVDNAYGGGNVIKNLSSKKFRKLIENCQYLAVMDTDAHFPTKEHVAAVSKDTKRKIHVIGMNPCIEALFLKMAEEFVPADTPSCKKRWSDFINTSCQGTVKTACIYQQCFPKEVLNKKRAKICVLDLLLNFIEGQLSSNIVYYNAKLSDDNN